MVERDLFGAGSFGKDKCILVGKEGVQNLGKKIGQISKVRVFGESPHSLV